MKRLRVTWLIWKAALTCPDRIELRGACPCPCGKMLVGIPGLDGNVGVKPATYRRLTKVRGMA